MNKEQISDVVESTEDFIAEVICPKLEEYGGADDELISNIKATCMTAAMAAANGITKYCKIDGKWQNNNPPRKKPASPKKPEEAEKPCEDCDDDCENGCAGDEIAPLIKKIVEVCDKRGRDMKEKNANFASTVLTMLEMAPNGARQMIVVGLADLITGEIRPD